MKASRHPHPHIDPRQPRNGSAPRTNPPIFVWKPAGEARPFRLTVARDAELADVVIDEASLTEPVHLPEKALEPGSYHWKWSQGDSEGEVFAFTIAPDAVTVEVPSSDVWLERFGTEHPLLARGRAGGPVGRARGGRGRAPRRAPRDLRPPVPA